MTIDNHNEWKERVQETNMGRCSDVLRQKKLSDCLQAWRVVHKWLRQKRWAKLALTERWISY